MSMVMMRFTRLPEVKQASLLDAAEKSLAEGGITSVSWNELLDAMQLPRASAYTYFDGREDLVNAVIQRITDTISASLGVWEVVDTAEEFWHQWENAIHEVLAILRARPSAGVILRKYLIPSQLPAVRLWLLAACDNAVSIGLVADKIPRELLVDMTLAILGVLDAWVIEQVDTTGQYPDFSLVRTIITRVWGTACEPSSQMSV